MPSRSPRRRLARSHLAALSFLLFHLAFAAQGLPDAQNSQAAQGGQLSPAQGNDHFSYDASAPLDLQEISVQTRDGATIHDLSYASPRHGRVPAYLVVPAAAQPTAKPNERFAAILWAHWMLPHSPTANRQEFLAEAVALAPTGVVSLLLDAPQLRPGFQPAPGAQILAQQVLDLRRGADLLLARADVDPHRLAFVGHSFDATAGALLDAVDKRFAAFVFMGGPQSTRQLVLASDSPHMLALRKSIPSAKLEQELTASAWADPATYAAQLGPAPALFQYGLHDEEWVPLADAKDFFAQASGPKEVEFYDSDHALNAAARRDRITFLERHLALRPLSVATVASIPLTH
jgi:hypothetical protein